MNTELIAKSVIAAGVEKMDLSMFPEEQRKEICARIAEALFKQNKVAEAVRVLESGNVQLPADRLEPIADYYFKTADYPTAYKIYQKIGYDQMAEFIRLNCL
ncbi:hypothetical protein HY488_03210 [Candidatus Woesearchaeota archaeon]|nr:hypothetical protein [Candidatus Woesearchaeota archaeon]